MAMARRSLKKIPSHPNSESAKITTMDRRVVLTSDVAVTDNFRKKIPDLTAGEEIPDDCVVVHGRRGP